MTKRILTAQFMHETNTFSVRKTDLQAFRDFYFFEGDAIHQSLADTNNEIAGFIDVAQSRDWELIHTVACYATPSGPVTDGAWDRVVGAILKTARTQGPFDGVLLSLHGSMVTQSTNDGERRLVSEIRSLLGPAVPIAVTLDLHANVAPAMVEDIQILCSYRTFPHIDMRRCGAQAAGLLARTMDGEIRPRVYIAKRPMLTAPEGGRTDIGPMPHWLERAEAECRDKDVLDVSINAGFSFSDVEDVGPSVTVTANGAHERFQRIAEGLMQAIWEGRDETVETLYPVEVAVGMAAQMQEVEQGPFIIADFSDNPGDGAYGDATNLLAAMLKADLSNAAFGALWDPEAAEIMHRIGKGGTVTLAIGGKTDPAHGGGPLTVSGTVVSATNGDFVCDGPMWKGVQQSTGPSAVLRVGGLDILVTSRVMQVIDRQIFIANGIDPERKATIGLKSIQHFRAAFEPIARKVVLADSGALASQDHATRSYRNVPRPLHPLDGIAG